MEGRKGRRRWRKWLKPLNEEYFHHIFTVIIKCANDLDVEQWSMVCVGGWGVVSTRWYTNYYFDFVIHPSIPREESPSRGRKKCYFLIFVDKKLGGVREEGWGAERNCYLQTKQ